MTQAVSTKRSLATHVYQELKQDILRCELRPGQEVYEGQLAQRYDVSKTPIREALNTLRQEGFVQVVPRRGYVVAPVSVQDVQHIFHVRLLLEPSAAELAAQHVSGEELAALRGLAQRRPSQTRAERMATNRSFHLAVARASRNPRLVAFISKLLEEVERVHHLGLDLKDDAGTGHDHHLALVDALMKGDHHLARDIMAEAVQASRKLVMEALVTTESRAYSLLVVGGSER